MWGRWGFVSRPRWCCEADGDLDRRPGDLAETCEACAGVLLVLGDTAGAERAVEAGLALGPARGVRARLHVGRARGARPLRLRAIDLGELLNVTPETISRWERGGLPVEHRALALLGGLVADKLAGRQETQARLLALRSPAEVPSTVRLDAA